MLECVNGAEGNRIGTDLPPVVFPRAVHARGWGQIPQIALKWLSMNALTLVPAPVASPSVPPRNAGSAIPVAGENAVSLGELLRLTLCPSLPLGGRRSGPRGCRWRNSHFHKMLAAVVNLTLLAGENRTLGILI